MRRLWDIAWSKHARERAQERRISEEAVQLVLVFGESKRTKEGVLVYVRRSALEDLSLRQQRLVWGVGVALRRDWSLITTVFWRKECDREADHGEVGPTQSLRMTLGDFLGWKSARTRQVRVEERVKERLQGVKPRHLVSAREGQGRLYIRIQPQLEEI